MRRSVQVSCLGRRCRRHLPGATIIAFVALGIVSANVAYSEGALPSPEIETTTSAAFGAPNGLQQGFAAASIIITCRIQVQHPHFSGHVKGTVNVVATTKCDAPVASIGMVLTLLRNGMPAGRAGINFLPGIEAQVNSAGPCIDGVYLGLLSWWIVWPPGFIPLNSNRGWLTSVPITLGCASPLPV